MQKAVVVMIAKISAKVSNRKLMKAIRRAGAHGSIADLVFRKFYCYQFQYLCPHAYTSFTPLYYYVQICFVSAEYSKLFSSDVKCDIHDQLSDQLSWISDHMLLWFFLQFFIVNFNLPKDQSQYQRVMWFLCLFSNWLLQIESDTVDQIW